MSMLTPRRCAALLALTLAIPLTSGCDKKTSAPAAGGAHAPAAGDGEFVAGSKTGGVFTMALADDPETLDPATMSGSPEGRIAFNIFEGLMMSGPTTEGLADAKDLVVPGAAASHTLSEDGKVYTFTLREGLKWSNGEPLTAQDFASSWQRVLQPDFTAPYAEMLYVIEGARAYNKGEITDFAQVGVKATDDRTLVVTLTNPTPFFPELIAFYTFFPTPKAAIEAHGKDWTRPEHIVSNGPYKLTLYKPQQELLLEKNEHYWDAANVKLEKVRLRIITDQNAKVNAYKTGELHWTGAALPVDKITSLLTHPDYFSEPMLGTYFYRVNVSQSGDHPLKDQRVRQALSMTVDRGLLADQTMNGLYNKATSFVPEGMPGYKSSTTLAYDPAQAKKLLTDAGYGPDKPLKVSLLYNTDENHKLIAEAIQDMWKRNLGVEVTLVNKEWKTYLQDTKTMSYELARAGWIGDYNDPMTFLDMWTTGNGNNNTGWSNAEFDSLLQQANQEPDAAKRMTLLQRAEQLLVEQGPVIPIYYYTNNMLRARQIKGFEAHNRDVHLFKYMALPTGTP